jgi:uncharacterized protein (TIGR02996 family)
VGGTPRLPTNPPVEAAIAANPEDTRSWSVFADWLLEQA